MGSTLRSKSCISTMQDLNPSRSRPGSQSRIMIVPLSVTAQSFVFVYAAFASASVIILRCFSPLRFRRVHTFLCDPKPLHDFGLFSWCPRQDLNLYDVTH